MTLENVKEVQSALDVMCKYCEQGLCDMCPDRETLRKVKEAYENRKLKERPNYCGIEDVRYISHGEWADAELEYKGKLFNENVVSDVMWERFIEEFPDKDGDYEAFNQYMYDNKDEVYELLEDWSD